MILNIENTDDIIFLYQKFSKSNFHCILRNGAFDYYTDLNLNSCSYKFCTSNKLLIPLFLSR